MAIALDHRGRASVLSPTPVFLAFAALLTGALATFVYAVPLNANDMLKHLFKFEDWGLWGTIWRDAIRSASYADYRPLQRPIGHMLYIAASGHEHVVFKGSLALTVAGIGWVFARALPVRTWGDAAAAALALMILFGHHSFAGAIEAVYPWGVDAVLVLCQVAVLAVLLRPASVWSTVGAVLISAFAIFLNEKGAVVGGTYLVGSVVRMPGASLHGSAGVVIGWLAYAAARLAVRDIFGVLGRAQKEGLLGNPTLDALAPALNLLFSDPRFGQFRTIPQALAGEPWAVVTLASSALVLASIVAWLVVNRGRDEAKAALLLAVAIAVSMLFGPFSPKDYIPIMALPAYALCAFYATRWLIALDRRTVTVIVVAMIALWAVRFAGLGYFLAATAHYSHLEWRDVERFGEVSKGEHDADLMARIIARMRGQVGAPWRHPDEVLPPFAASLLRGRGCPELCK